MIRSLQPADAAVVADLEQGCARRPWSLASLQSALSSAHTRGWILADDQPLAYLFGHQVLDEAEIHSIGVLPSHQRRGLGRQILHHGLSTWRADGVHHVHLEVRADNLPAVALYQGSGFRPVGRRVRYYGDVDALLLKATL